MFPMIGSKEAALADGANHPNRGACKPAPRGRAQTQPRRWRRSTQKRRRPLPAGAFSDQMCNARQPGPTACGAPSQYGVDAPGTSLPPGAEAHPPQFGLDPLAAGPAPYP
jgi:hypothetical protein